MKQVFSGAGHIVLAIFTVAIIVFMAIMNYQTLGRVFPDDPSQQLWGMVLFTGGTLCWFTIFLLASRGFQRPIALVMFFLSLGGEVLYSAADVIMGGQKWIEQTPALGTYVIYSFIFLTFAHGLALYIHFFVKPEVWASVDLEAIEDSVKKMAQERAAELINLRIEPMADQLAARVTNSVYANLRLPVPDVIDGVVLQDDTNDLRQAQAATDDAKKAGWFDWLFAWKTKQSQQDPAATPTPVPANPPPPPSYTLEGLLSRLGMGAAEARAQLTRFGLDKDPDRCFDLMNQYGILPNDMDRVAFSRLHLELFTQAEGASGAGANFRPQTA